MDVKSRFFCKLPRDMNCLKLAPQVHQRLIPNFSYIHCSVDEHQPVVHPTLTEMTDLFEALLLSSPPPSVSIEMMCCYPTASCSWMFWPVCRCDEASALGSERAAGRRRAAAPGQHPGRGRRWESGGRGVWLINKAECRSPPLLGILSPFCMSPVVTPISTSPKRQQGWRGWRVEGAGGDSSSLPAPEALHMEITASCQLSSPNSEKQGSWRKKKKKA